ncbi:MAG TPA: rhodanese-like domain-containing protein, partial [Holophaga sp.]|nr:rhodanese-like domain-containing protein [Holophaga sp.]
PFPAVQGSPVREITPSQAWEAWQAGVPFLDARRSGDYAEGHVKGAWSLPVWEDGLQEAITRFEAQAAPDPKAPLVLYCAGGGCEDSHLLARRLLELGYRNLLVYGGGWPDWTAKGHPGTKGASR